MTTLALFRPTGLLATELREALDDEPELRDDVRLISDDEDEVGTLTQLGDAAALVAAADDVTLAALDVALFFGRRESYGATLERVPEGVARLVLSTELDPEEGRPIVAGVNSEAIRRDALLLSPHPVVVALAHLLHPLRELAPSAVSATLLLPVSLFGKEGLDEMLQQTRDLLSFQSEPRREVLPAQLAFNAVDLGDDASALVEQLASVLGETDDEPAAPGPSLHLVRVGVFHSLAVSLHLRFADDPGTDAVRRALAAHPYLELRDEGDDAGLGATDAASSEEILVGRIEGDGRGGYRLWAVLDNLVAGGTRNALEILRRLVDVGS